MKLFRPITAPASGEIKGRARITTILHDWAPIVAWVTLMFLFSTEVFNGGFTYRIVRAVLLFFFPNLSLHTIAVINTILRKLAHVFEFFVLTLLLYRAFRQDVRGNRRWRWVVLSFLLALGMAGLDELHQSFTPTRIPSMADVGIDAFGALIAQPVAWWRDRRRYQRSDSA